MQRRELPPQQVRYCRAKDGTQLAFSVLGDGPPLVKTANWLNHIEHDWESPLWRHWIDQFTDGRSLIRYDERGNGLSDWDTPELSFEAFIDDLECVADCLALERFDLLAISQGAAVAVAYAVRHPERVRRLVICNGYAAGWAVRSDPSELARREAMVTLTQLGWGADPAYRQLFTNHYVPDATPKQMGWFNEMQRLSASPDNAVRLQRVLSQIDARDLLPRVRTPTLIFHSRDDQAVPFLAGRGVSRQNPRRELHPAGGQNHILLGTEPAWTFTACRQFFLMGTDKPFDLTRSARFVARPSQVREQCTSALMVLASAIRIMRRGRVRRLMPGSVWFHHLEKDLSSARSWAALDGRVLHADAG